MKLVIISTFCVHHYFQYHVQSLILVHVVTYKKIKSTFPSGYYNVTLSNGIKFEVYCDMKGSYCDGEGGRTRVVFVNMSEPGSSCPPGLVQYDDIFNTSLCYIHERAYISNLWLFVILHSFLLMVSTIPRCVVK